MKLILYLLLVAGALTLVAGLGATAEQSTPSPAQAQTSADPQEKASPQASSRSHHHRRNSTTRHTTRHHKRCPSINRKFES
jgi:hypothetical protein